MRDVDPELAAAIETEAEAWAAEVRARRRVDILLARVARGHAQAADADGPGRPALLTRAELARALHISVATIDRMAGDGAPFVQVGRRRRFALPDISAWLASRPVQRRARPEAETDPIDVSTIARAAGLRVNGAR